VTGYGIRRAVTGMLMNKGDRDFFYGDGSYYLLAVLKVPTWSKAHYDIRAISMTGAAVRTSGQLPRTLPFAALPSLPRRERRSVVGRSLSFGYVARVLEIFPVDPATDFGAWPYRLEVNGL